jgi:hypothetical protein
MKKSVPKKRLKISFFDVFGERKPSFFDGFGERKTSKNDVFG